MTGETVYRADQQHMCEPWSCHDPVGSIWRCNVCGGYWKRHSVGLMRAGGWYPATRWELRQMRRRQA